MHYMTLCCYDKRSMDTRAEHKCEQVVIHTQGHISLALSSSPISVHLLLRALH